jgi:carbonic anhydrase
MFLTCNHILILGDSIAIPAAIMDHGLKKNIEGLADRIRVLEIRVTNLEAQNKELQKEMEKDVHQHVKKLVSQIQKMDKELKDLKSRIRFPVD